MSKRCKCKVCNKEFEYGDEQSPVFVDEIWWDLLDAYGLWRYEARARKLNMEAHIRWRASGGKGGFPNRAEYHCFICYECAEKALGRKLTPEDIEQCGFNDPFNKFYYCCPVKNDKIIYSLQI